jgi:hypothetical protein
MTYPPPPVPAAPAPSGKPRLRGRIPLRLALIFGIVAVVALGIGIYFLATQSLTKVNDFQRVTVADGTGTVSFANTGGYIAYYEASDVSSDTDSIPTVRVALRNQKTQQVMELKTLYGDNSNGTITKLTYDYNGHSGAALYQFHISATGKYDVAVQGTTDTASDAKIAFGKSIAKGTAIGGGLVAGGVLFLIPAIVLFIVGLVKRSRHKKELATAGSYGYPPPPGYNPPAPGYPAPQQGWQQPPPPPPDQPGQSGPWPPSSG